MTAVLVMGGTNEEATAEEYSKGLETCESLATASCDSTYTWFCMAAIMKSWGDLYLPERICLLISSARSGGMSRMYLKLHHAK